MTGGRDELPKVFIGSSTEQLEIAETIQELLDYETEPTVWSQGIFSPSRFALSELVRASHSFDFGIFVFTPDDLVLLRGAEVPSARDNVIFELGLFMGALEPTRCFIVTPRGSNLHLPTDLLGVVPLTYSASRSDKNLAAALGPTCLKVRRAIRDRRSGSLTSAEQRRSNEPLSAPRVNRSLDQFIAEWSGPDLVAAQETVRNMPFDPYDNDFQHRHKPSFKRIFMFLDELAETILSGTVDERRAREHFENAIITTWRVGHTLLAPPNHADEWWDPPPPIARLSLQWQKK